MTVRRCARQQLEIARRARNSTCICSKNRQNKWQTTTDGRLWASHRQCRRRAAAELEPWEVVGWTRRRATLIGRGMEGWESKSLCRWQQEWQRWVILFSAPIFHSVVMPTELAMTEPVPASLPIQHTPSWPRRNCSHTRTFTHSLSLSFYNRNKPPFSWPAFPILPVTYIVCQCSHGSETLLFGLISA